MAQKPEEWIKQADYDMETAELMLSGGKNFYAVFMCHLSIEKALKGLYQKSLEEIPLRTHSLVLLIKKIGKKPPEHIGKFIVKLNEANVATRYPEELDTLQKEYTKSVVADILSSSKEVLAWIKTQF